jgi:hypothetical protein
VAGGGGQVREGGGSEWGPTVEQEKKEKARRRARVPTHAAAARTAGWRRRRPARLHAGSGWARATGWDAQQQRAPPIPPHSSPSSTPNTHLADLGRLVHDGVVHAVAKHGWAVVAVAVEADGVRAVVLARKENGQRPAAPAPAEKEGLGRPREAGPAPLARTGCERARAVRTCGVRACAWDVSAHACVFSPPLSAPPERETQEWGGALARARVVLLAQTVYFFLSLFSAGKAPSQHTAMPPSPARG